MELPSGLMLGHYLLQRKVGKGGFGITYLAEHTLNHELVVIKENFPIFYAYRDKDTLQVCPRDDGAVADYAHTQQRFVEEARTLARLNHPNIVRVYEAFEAFGTAYYVMPLVTGKELHKAAPPIVNEEWLLPILKSILKALDYLHGQNLLHRDIKPNNIILREDGTPILIDFGTARALQSEHSVTLIGTPGYTPIEQLSPNGNRGPWTDIYALGATCYRLITGACPPLATERMDDEDAYRALSGRAELKKRFSEILLRSIDKALSLRTKNRWQSAQDWLKELKKITPRRTHSRTIPTTVITAATAQPRMMKPAASGIFTQVFIGLFVEGMVAISYSAYTHLSAAEPTRDTLPLSQLSTLIILLVVLSAAVYGVYSYTHTSAKKRRREEFTQAKKSRKAEKKAQKKLAAMGITDYDSAILEAYDNPEKLALLITAGADVNKENKYGHTPLYWAADKGDTECVKLLLAAPGIDVNKADKYGYTSLYRAVRANHTQCTKLLLDAPGIHVNKENAYGVTPLSRAAYGNLTECVKLLLAAPAIDINKADTYGRTPLYWAERNGHTEIVELLQAAGKKK